MGALRFVELFAGAGGLSEGFVRQGYKPIAFVEQDRYCCQTLKTRLVYHQLKKRRRLNLYYDYLRGAITQDTLCKAINQQTLRKIICKKIAHNTLDSIIEHIKLCAEGNGIDVLLGGPPCQAYSLIGRAQNQHKKNDDRMYLYKHYLAMLQELRPHVFVFENVPGLLSIDKGTLFKEIISDFKSLGYEVNYQILDASHFNVLQTRRRVVVVGCKNQLINIDIKQSQKNYRVADILCDLKPLHAGDKNNQYAGKPSKYLEKSNIRTKEDILTWHEARPHHDRDLKIYQQVVQFWNKQKQRLRYFEVDESLKTHKNQTTFLDRFKVVAADLPTSHTMVAHIAKDGHHYIHPDISQNRSLSVREAARIQSFPDNYFFEGPRTSAFTQIGNAVPPLLSASIAKQVQAAL